MNGPYVFDNLVDCHIVWQCSIALSADVRPVLDQMDDNASTVWIICGCGHTHWSVSIIVFEFDVGIGLHEYLNTTVLVLQTEKRDEDSTYAMGGMHDAAASCSGVLFFASSTLTEQFGGVASIKLA